MSNLKTYEYNRLMKMTHANRNADLRKTALAMLNNHTIWKYTSSRSKFHISFINGLGRKINTGNNASAFGHVYELKANQYNLPNNTNNNIMYVAKLMHFKDNTDKNIFINEVNVGGGINNKNLGPRIYAYAISPTYGLYIMDHFKMGDSSVNMMSMINYLTKFYPNACPPQDSLVIKKAKATLQRFYIKTRGYHGDLHTGNLYVIYKNDPKDVLKVIIFDYGAHTKFNSPLTRRNCKSLNTLLERINQNFDSKKRKLQQNNINYYPHNTRMPLLYLKNKQPLRSNAKMLRLINAQRPFQMYNKDNGYPLI